MVQKFGMKVLLTFFVLFLFPILISCNSYSGSSDKTVCVDTDALIRNGIIYLPNETKPFTGNNLCKYENGQIKSERTYKDGKLVAGIYVNEGGGAVSTLNGKGEVTSSLP